MDIEYELRTNREDDWTRVREMEQEIFVEDQFRKDQFLNRIARGNFWALEIDGVVYGELAVGRIW